MFRSALNRACQEHLPPTLPTTVSSFIFFCLLLQFFSHIADMPGLACLNCLKAEANQRAAQCVIAQQLLKHSSGAQCSSAGQDRSGPGAAVLRNGHWLAPACAAGGPVTHGVARSQTGQVPLVFTETQCALHTPVVCLFLIRRDLPLSLSPLMKKSVYVMCWLLVQQVNTGTTVREQLPLGEVQEKTGLVPF